MQWHVRILWLAATSAAAMSPVQASEPEQSYACSKLVCPTLIPGPPPEDAGTQDCAYSTGNAWWLDYVAAPVLWLQPAPRRPVIVALFDDGADINHPDLRNQLWTNERESHGQPGRDDDGNGYVDDLHGWNFVDDNSNVAPEGACAGRPSHGTFMASLIAAQRNGGGALVAPGADAVRLMILRISGCGATPERFEPDRIVRALHYATSMGARILSFSAHWPRSTPELDAAFAEIADSASGPNQAIIVASVPNKGEPQAGYPAAYPFRRIVRAIPIGDSDSISPGTSQAPPGLNLGSPSACILGATATNARYTLASGSSNSTAILSSLLAGIWASSPYATLPAEQFIERVVRDRMMTTPRRSAPVRALYPDGVPIADACVLAGKGGSARVCKSEQGRATFGPDREHQ